MGQNQAVKELPDTPEPQQVETSAKQQTTLPTDIRYPQSISWKQAADWKFIAIHAGFAVAVFGDQLATMRGQDKGCAIEANPVPHRTSWGELAAKNWPIWAGVTFMDLMLKKAGVKYAWWSGAAVGSAKHLYGVAEWYNTCRVQGINLAGDRQYK